MQVLPAKAKDKKKIAQEDILEVRNQNGEYLVNLCHSNIPETQVIYPICGHNFISVFPVESANDIKI